MRAIGRVVTTAGLWMVLHGVAAPSHRPSATVELIAGGGVQYPGILSVREVKGKLLGQKFNEVMD